MGYLFKIYLFVIFALCYANNHELVPLEAPSNLSLIKIVGKNVDVQWEPVSSESVRGNFQGYLVRIWNHAGSQVYAFSNNITKATIDFFPYSKNFITVSVRNEKYVGPPSSAISFDAPQIAPNVPYIFQVYLLNEKSVFLKWNKPTQPNGVLTGYKVYCSEIRGDRSVNEISHLIYDPDKLQAKLTEMVEGVKYKISISALNCAGESEKNSVEITMDEHHRSQPSSADFLYKINYKVASKEEKCKKKYKEIEPAVAGFEQEKITKDYDYDDYLMINETQKNKIITDKTSILNEIDKNQCKSFCIIMWLPDINNNPGEYFYVKYRIRGEKEFNITEPEKSEDFIVLKEFNACKNYEIILTALDGEFSVDSKLKVTPTRIFS